jgi:hypothetical protein
MQSYVASPSDLLVSSSWRAILDPEVPTDAGAASGLVNVAHQLGTVFAAAGSAALGPRDLLAHRVAASLTVGTGMLELALVLVVALIVRPRRAER